MGIPLYLAMTAAEFANCTQLPHFSAWMACHFSPYGTGLSNLPTALPEGSLLILNDRTPICGHDPHLVSATLRETADRFHCCGVLLDFQRQEQEELLPVIREVLTLPCPVAVSDLYAREFDCPVFLPPVPILQTLQQHICPWADREIWLEAELPSARIAVTETGSTQTLLPWEDPPSCPLEDVQLRCHYSFKIEEKQAVFTLKRTKTDLNNLLKDAEKYRITHAIGLWQELK